MTNYKLRKREQLLVTVFKGIVTVTKQNHSSPQTVLVSSLLKNATNFFCVFLDCIDQVMYFHTVATGKKKNKISFKILFLKNKE